MAHYPIQIHKTAKHELDTLTLEAKNRVVDVIEEVSETQQVSSHEKCSKLKGQDVYKIRVGDYRVLFKLEKPNLKVIKVSRRSTAYRNHDDLLERV